MKIRPILFALAGAAALYAQQPGAAPPSPAPAPVDPFLKSAHAPANGVPDLADRIGEIAQALAKAPAASELAGEILARIEIFSLPHTLASKVQRQFPKSVDLYAWIDAELKKPQSEVKLDHLSALKTRSGNQSRLENINEYPYPTDFHPPQIPQNFSVGQPLSVSNVEVNTPPSPVVPEPKPKPAPTPPVAPAPPTPPVPGAQGEKSVPGAAATEAHPPVATLPDSLAMPPWPYEPTVPTSFEIRNLGWTFEMDAVIEEDMETVEVTIAPELARLVAIQPMSPSGEVENPIFEIGNLTTQFRAKMNQPCFVGTISRPLNTGVQNGNTENRVRLFFFTPVRPASEIPTHIRENAGEDLRDTRVHFDCFSLPLAAARTAMLAHPKEQDLFRWLDAEIEKPESGVVMEQTHTVAVRNGERSKVKSIDEFPFPKDILPPHILESPSLPLEARPTPSAAPGYSYPAWPRVPLTPTGMEFRDLGWTGELDIVINDNGWLADLNVAPEMVRLVGSVAWGATREFIKPVFETQKVITSFQAVIGQPTMVSTFSPPVNTGAPGGNSGDRVWFLFVTVTASH